jgi:YggT family protein
VFAYIVASIKFVIFYFTVPVSIPIALIAYLSLLTLIKQAGVLLFWILIARAVLSWISQGRSTVEYVLGQLTEPLLTPIRRIIPSIGGLDLSFLILFLILQFINTTLGMYVPGWLNA